MWGGIRGVCIYRFEGSSAYQHAMCAAMLVEVPRAEHVVCGQEVEARGLGWVGLGWVGLSWEELGLGWVRMGLDGFGWVGRNWVGDNVGRVGSGRNGICMEGRDELQSRMQFILEHAAHAIPLTAAHLRALQVLLLLSTHPRFVNPATHTVDA